MSFRTLMATMALALSLGLAAWPASAEGGRNYMVLGRWGAHKGAGLGRDGHRNCV